MRSISKSLTNRVKELTILFIYFICVLGCSNGVKTDKDMIGLEEHEVVVKLDNPSINKVINLTANTRLSEYESRLYTLFPDFKTSDTVQIKELLWQRTDDTVKYPKSS